MKTSMTHWSRLAGAVAVVLLAGVVSASAQPGRRMPDPEQRLERMMSHLSPALELTDEQASKVRGILGEQIKKQQEMFEARRSQEQTERQAMRTEMEKWRTETDARMADVLTADQVEKYQKYMEKNRRGPRGEPGDRKGRRGRRW